MKGGLTYPEEEARKSRDRLEMATEKHTIVKLPCCGTGIELKDHRQDQYVVCPNKKCRKRHVILGHSQQVKSEVTQDAPSNRLIY